MAVGRPSRSAVGLNVQVKSADAPGASEATLAGVQTVQPVPDTKTFVSVSLPVLVSRTTIVIRVPGTTGLAGVWLTVVSVVDTTG